MYATDFCPSHNAVRRDLYQDQRRRYLKAARARASHPGMGWGRAGQDKEEEEEETAAGILSECYERLQRNGGGKCSGQAISSVLIAPIVQSLAV